MWILNEFPWREPLAASWQQPLRELAQGRYLSVESEQAVTDTGKIQQLFDQLCLNLALRSITFMPCAKVLSSAHPSLINRVSR